MGGRTLESVGQWSHHMNFLVHEPASKGHIRNFWYRSTSLGSVSRAFGGVSSRTMAGSIGMFQGPKPVHIPIPLIHSNPTDSPSQNGSPTNFTSHPPRIWTLDHLPPARTAPPPERDGSEPHLLRDRRDRPLLPDEIRL